MTRLFRSGEISPKKIGLSRNSETTEIQNRCKRWKSGHVLSPRMFYGQDSPPGMTATVWGEFHPA